MYPILKHTDIFLNNDPYHFAYATFGKNKRFGLHTHDFYEFIIVEEGSLRQMLNGSPFYMDKNTFCLIRPDDLHSVSSKDNKAVKIYNLAITAKLYHQALRFLDPDNRKMIKPKAEIPVDKREAFFSVISYINSNYLQKNNSFLGIHIKELIVELMVMLMDTSEDRYKEIPLWLARACKEMLEKENFKQGLKRFIDLGGRSQEHLNRSMKRYYGITPTAFINRLRLQFAAFELRTSDQPVTDIIYNSGFENISHFSRLFKKNYQLTPGQYRLFHKTIYNPE